MADLLALTPVWFCYFRSSVIGVFLLHQQVSGNIIAFLFIAFAVSWHAWCWNPIVLSSGWTTQQMFQENLSFFHTRCIPGFKTLKSQGVQYPLLSSWVTSPSMRALLGQGSRGYPSPELCQLTSVHFFLSQFSSHPAVLQELWQGSCAGDTGDVLNWEQLMLSVTTAWGVSALDFVFWYSSHLAHFLIILDYPWIRMGAH